MKKQLIFIATVLAVAITLLLLLGLPRDREQSTTFRDFTSKHLDKIEFDRSECLPSPCQIKLAQSLKDASVQAKLFLVGSFLSLDEAKKGFAWLLRQDPQNFSETFEVQPKINLQTRRINVADEKLEIHVAKDGQVFSVLNNKVELVTHLPEEIAQNGNIEDLQGLGRLYRGIKISNFNPLAGEVELSLDAKNITKKWPKEIIVGFQHPQRKKAVFDKVAALITVNFVDRIQLPDQAQNSRAAAVVQCSNNNQCSSKQTCSNGVCTGNCRINTDCRVGEKCLDFNCTTIGCTSNNNCALTQVCSNGTCTGNCRTDANCATSQVCKNNTCTGNCRTNANCTSKQTCVSNNCTGSCRVNSDCKSGQTCQNLTCKSTSKCTSNNNCALTQVCSNGTCTGNCRTNTDCQSNQVCSSNFCKGNCRTNANCTSKQICANNICTGNCRINTDCASSQTCVNNFCK